MQQVGHQVLPRSARGRPQAAACTLPQRRSTAHARHKHSHAPRTCSTASPLAFTCWYVSDAVYRPSAYLRTGRSAIGDAYVIMFIVMTSPGGGPSGQAGQIDEREGESVKTQQ